MLQNWLSSNKNVIATSENQITSDDNAMRDLGTFFITGLNWSKVVPLQRAADETVIFRQSYRRK